MRLEIKQYNQSDVESTPSDYQEIDQQYDEAMGQPDKYPRIDSPKMISNKDSININLKKKYALINAPISPIRQQQKGDGGRSESLKKRAMGVKNKKFFEQSKMISKTQHDGIYIVASG